MIRALIQALLQAAKQYLEACRRKQTEDLILKKCGCICYCPGCKAILQVSAECEDTDLVRYKCECGRKSYWNFDICPIPMQVDEDGTPLHMKDEATQPNPKG